MYIKDVKIFYYNNKIFLQIFQSTVWQLTAQIPLLKIFIYKTFKTIKIRRFKKSNKNNMIINGSFNR